MSRIDVDVARIDGELQVVGATSCWHPVAAVAAMPLRSVESALADLQAGKGAIDAPEGAKRLVVESVVLAYWEDPVPARQPYVQPVYHFEGTAWVGGERQPLGATASALDPSVLQPLPTSDAGAAAEPIVPEAALSRAEIVHEGQRTPMSAEAQSGLAAALSTALKGARGRIVGFAPVQGFTVKAETALEASTTALDVTYAAPVEMSLSLENMPKRLETDSAGRYSLTISRLIVEEAGKLLLFTCLPPDEEYAYGVGFDIPRGPWSAALEELMRPEYAPVLARR
ncbi:MAG: hypothetical protein ACUVX9_11295 [Anaerolineae bacterium]